MPEGVAVAEDLQHLGMGRSSRIASISAAWRAVEMERTIFSVGVGSPVSSEGASATRATRRTRS
jgi:hypothetical protein